MSRYKVSRFWFFVAYALVPQAIQWLAALAVIVGIYEVVDSISHF